MAGTEEKAVATTGENAVFDISQMPDLQEIKEVMAENMEGVDLKFERIKVPSGGFTAWEVPTEDGDTDTAKELSGVIIDHHPVNAYWAEKYTGESNPPTCSAMDAMVGIDQNGNKHDCAGCPQNQWGSDPDGGNGKACKNLHRIYFVREGEFFPLLLAVPPTSLDNLKTYLRRLTGRMKRITGVLTKFTLEKDKNDGGIEFSKIVFNRAGDLDKETAKQMKEFAETMKPHLRQIGITDDEYSTAGEPDITATATEVNSEENAW